MADADSTDDTALPVTDRPTTLTRDLEATRAGDRDVARRPAPRRRRRARARPRRSPPPTACRARRCCSTRCGPKRAPSGSSRSWHGSPPTPRTCPCSGRTTSEGQFDVMRQVALHTSVPVPRVHWLERDPDGAGRAVLRDGEAVRGGPARSHALSIRRQLAVRRVARGPARARRTRPSRCSRSCTASTSPSCASRSSTSTGPSRRALGRHVGDWEDYYTWIVADGLRSPLLEACLAWLHEHWPTDDGGAVFNWGDSRWATCCTATSARSRCSTGR